VKLTEAEPEQADYIGVPGRPVQARALPLLRGKLLINLGNALEASLGRGNDRGDWPERVRAEAEGVLRAAGLAWDDVGMDSPRRKALMQMGDVPGEARFGGSTTQSLVRGTGRVETDYLNGEIAWLARLHGQEAPLNAFLAWSARPWPSAVPRRGCWICTRWKPCSRIGRQGALLHCRTDRHEAREQRCNGF
jgi:hypothetical protein